MSRPRELKAPRGVIIFFVLFAFSMIFYCFWHHDEAYSVTKTANPDEASLKKLLRKASMQDKNSVIVTILDEEWADPGSIFDIFLEGFRYGHGIKNFLNNIIVFTVDDKTHEYCKSLHRHCFNIATYRTNSFWRTFKKMNNPKLGWRTVDILGEILDYGYSIVFTETDVLWLRNPFSHFNFKAEIITSRDNSHNNVSDLAFFYLRANERSVQFFKYWKMSSISYPNLSHKSVFEIIKEDPFTEMLELEIDYLDTNVFNSFCEPNGSMICTIHAKCSGSRERKVQNLRKVLDFAKNSTLLTRENGLIKAYSASEENVV